MPLPIRLREEMTIARIRKRMTQGEVAKALGVSRQYYSSIESGACNIQSELFAKLKKVLDAKELKWEE